MLTWIVININNEAFTELKAESVHPWAIPGLPKQYPFDLTACSRLIFLEYLAFWGRGEDDTYDAHAVQQTGVAGMRNEPRAPQHHRAGTPLL